MNLNPERRGQSQGAPAVFSNGNVQTFVAMNQLEWL